MNAPSNAIGAPPDALGGVSAISAYPEPQRPCGARFQAGVICHHCNPEWERIAA